MKPVIVSSVAKAGSLIAVVLLLVACSTNSLVIGYFYNRMDNRMNDRILSVASFDEAQRTEIKASVDEFFAWHRRYELPRYERYLSGIEQEIALGTISGTSIVNHIDTLRGFTRTAFLRSPFANSANFLKTLTDGQVVEVGDYFEKQDREFLEWIEKREKEGGDSRRVDTIVKNVGRFGINLGDMQRQVIAEGIARLQSDPFDRRALWNRWEQQLLTLLGQRDQPGFEQRVAAHIAVYQDQNVIHRPQQTAHNRHVVAGMIEDILRSLDPRQREILLSKLGEIRESIIKLSRDA